MWKSQGAQQEKPGMRRQHDADREKHRAKIH